jgi:hypothetical protein
VARPGLGRLDEGVREELHGRPQDAVRLAVEDDGAVHLRELAQTGRRELDVQHEAAGADGLDGGVEAEDDERAGAAAEDAFEPVTELGARGHGGQGLAEEFVDVRGGVGHERILRVAGG